MPYSVKFSSRLNSLLPVAILILISISSIERASASTQHDDVFKQAYQSYIAEKYNQAADYYRQIKDFDGRFGEGNSYYKLTKYTQAISQFNQAVILANNDSQRGSAIYNLANANFMIGDYALATVLYKDSLLYRPSHPATISNLRISSALQRIIDDQIQQGMANRMGTGPRTARAEQGLEINNQGAMAFDNEEERKKGKFPLPEIPSQELSRLLAKGIAHSRLVKNGTSSANALNTERSRWNQDIASARIRMRELEDQQIFLWKRLFEMEEGFAAPLEESEIVPGTLPW